MKISCPSCQAKYSIADEKVQDRLAKIRCRKCSTTIVIDGKVSPASVYAADAGGDASPDTGASADAEQAASSAGAQVAASSAAGGAEYTVDYGDNDQRTMALDQVVAAYNAGEITAETYVWAEGFADWTPLSQVGEIVEALHAAAGSAPPEAEEAPAPGPAETPWQQPAAAAATTGGADLFGSYDRAGSEDDADLATSAASPAPAPRVPTAGAATGARNESSVLFSLSALTSAASNSKPSVSQPSSPGVTEDSGLIDLKALTAAASSVGDSPLAPQPGASPSPLGGAPLGGAPLGVSPLGGGMPLGGVATAMDISVPQNQGKNKTGLFIAGGIVVAAVAVTLIIQLTGGAKEEAAAPTAVAPTPVATIATADPAPEPEPEPAATEEETEAKPPATGTAEEEEPPEPAKTAAAPRKTTPRKTTTTSSSKSTSSSSKSTSSSSPAPAPAKPKPATNKCGCKPGDLQCAMRCAAGG